MAGLASSGGGLDGGGLDGGGLELPHMLVSSVIVTVMLPGFTVSVPLAHSPPPPPQAGTASLRAPVAPPATPPAESETAVVRPEARVPAVGDTVTRPARLEDSAMDQLTGPNPETFRVSEPPLAPSTIVVGVTVSRPWRGGDELAVVEGLLGDGAGELGLPLELDAGPEVVGDG